MIDSQMLTDFLVTKKITANQFYLCHLIYVKDMKNLQKYVTTEFKNQKGMLKSLAFRQNEVEDLIEKGYLVKTGSGDSIADYETTEKFSNDYYIDEEEAGEQLWETYPKLLIIDGIYQSTRTVDKEEILEIYAKRIKNSRKKHSYVLDMTRRFRDLIKNNEMQGMGIEKWVKGENWETIGEIIGISYDNTSFI